MHAYNTIGVQYILLSLVSFLQNSLTPGNNLVTNCTISDWSHWKRTYQPGLAWGGVGNNYTYLDISNAPHAGILGGGECRYFIFKLH